MALKNHGFDANKNVADFSSLVERVEKLEKAPTCPIQVGGIYISTNNVNPSTFTGWGNTTWVQFGAGRTLIGVQSNDSDFSSSEKVGGSKTTSSLSVSVRGNLPANTGSTTLALNQIPSHRHDVRIYRDSDPSMLNDGYIYLDGQGGGSASHYHLFPGSDSAAQPTAGMINKGSGFGAVGRHLTTYEVGGGAGHTHTIGGTLTSTGTIAATRVLNPYITVYFWKRTA